LFVPESTGLVNFCIAARDQIPQATAMAGKLAGHHGAAVVAGSAPATLRKPPAAVVPTVAAKPVLTTVFAIRSIKFTDPVSGSLTVVQKFQDVQMSPEMARVTNGSVPACSLVGHCVFM
jgi:hypothetical protein